MTKLSDSEVLLIRECEMERERLRDELVEMDKDYKARRREMEESYKSKREKVKSQIQQLSRYSLAEKFDCSQDTIRACWHRPVR